MLSNEIHEILYGTSRGTAPLSPVGSAYYNGGIVGVILLFASLGVVYTCIYYRYLTGARSVARSMTYGFIFFYLSIYVVDAPINLLENGVLTFLLLLLLMKIGVERSSVSASRAGAV